VKDTKGILQILVMYLPLFVYWALLSQQTSRWVFQATFMDGNIGGFYTIKPAQMVVATPFFILVLLPLFKNLVFPILEPCGLNTPLRKMGVGMFLAVLTFICSAYLEHIIHQKYISILW
jgi:dipeptide/tripeptide permease